VTRMITREDTFHTHSAMFWVSWQWQSGDKACGAIVSSLTRHGPTTSQR
jgi:hypothetical protein